MRRVGEARGGGGRSRRDERREGRKREAEQCGKKFWRVD